MKAFEQNLPLSQVENEYFGVDHAQIGQEWLNRQKFHRTVRYVTAYHEDPDNCFEALAQSGKMAFVTAMITSSKDEEITLLTHLISCANVLAKELGLGYSGNPHLEQTPWIDQPTTQLIFEARSKEVMLEDFKEFFMDTCSSLPDLPFTQLAHAERGAAAHLGEKPEGSEREEVGGAATR